MTSRGRPLAWIFSASAGIAGCNLVFSLDGYAGTSRGNCSHCAGTHCECAPKPPDNFDYARLLRAPKAGTLCPPGMALGQAIGSGQRDTGCACTCQSPAPGSECGLAVFSAQACAGPIATTIVASSGCVALPTAADRSARMMVASGSCTADAKANTPEFEVPFLACLDTKPASDGACDSGSLCTTSAGSPFETAACVMAKSEVVSSCPPEYPHGYKFSTGLDDSRTCDKASCACKPQPCTSDAKAFLCLDSACGNCKGSTSSTCVDFGGLSYGKVDVAGTTTGSCEPTGTSALLSGTLTATGALLVCCDDVIAVTP